MAFLVQVSQILRRSFGSKVVGFPAEFLANCLGLKPDKHEGKGSRLMELTP